MADNPVRDKVIHPAVALASRLLMFLLTGENGHPGRPSRRTGWIPVETVDELHDQLTAIATADEPTDPIPAVMPAASEPLPFYDAVRTLLAAELGNDAVADHLAGVLLDAKLVTAQSTAQVAQVPEDAEWQLDHGARFPLRNAPVGNQLLNLILSWPLRRRPDPGVPRVWRSTRPAEVRMPSGLPWRGPVQVTVWQDGQVNVAVRDVRGMALAPLEMAEVETSAVVHHG